MGGLWHCFTNAIIGFHGNNSRIYMDLHHLTMENYLETIKYTKYPQKIYLRKPLSTKYPQKIHLPPCAFPLPQTSPDPRCRHCSRSLRPQRQRGRNSCNAKIPVPPSPVPRLGRGAHFAMGNSRQNREIPRFLDRENQGKTWEDGKIHHEIDGLAWKTNLNNKHWDFVCRFFFDNFMWI